MPDPNEDGKSLAGTREQKFLTAEYQALISLDAARNQKLDGFLTLYMTLAAAPWALYALTFKEHGVPAISTIPSLVALSFVLTGILGALVAMMYIQVWFNIVLYMRSVNAIRGYFLEKETQLTFHLPISSQVPPYYAKGSYIQFAVNGMALVNSGYIVLGVFNLMQGMGSPAWRGFGVLALFMFCMIAHRRYYRSQADARDVRSKGPHLRWQK